MPSFTRSRLFPAALLFFLAACGDALRPTDILGHYAATTLKFVQGSDTIDVLGGGGTLTMTLNGNATTTGQAYVPASVNYGVEAIASMVGTFAIRGGIVTFDQTARTFVRDMAFTLSGKTLSGNLDDHGTIVICVLTRP